MLLVIITFYDYPSRDQKVNNFNNMSKCFMLENVCYDKITKSY